MTTPTAEEVRSQSERNGAGERVRVYLQPGQRFVTARPIALVTVLGSCVAVTLWDSVKKVGGMNHFLLPHWVDSAQSSWRFGNVAVDGLIDEVLASGAQRSGLEAKVFGGARVLAGLSGAGGELGARNLEVAYQVLAARSVPVTASAVGGDHGRKVVFHTDDGNAWVKTL